MIIEEGKQICVEETQNSENQMNSASNQIIEIVVNIEQVFRPQTNRNDNTVNSVPSGEVDEQVKGLSDTVIEAKPYLPQTITDVMQLKQCGVSEPQNFC